MFKYFFTIISLFAVVSCSFRNSNQLPNKIKDLSNLKVYSLPDKIDTIQLNKQRVFSSTKNVIMGRIGDIAIDKNGRVFIADMTKKTIDVFKPDGTYLTNIGRSGKGPGEFMAIAGIKIRYHKIYVYDTRLQRISIFSLDSLLLFDETKVKPINGMLGLKFYFNDDSTFMIEFNDIGLGNTKRYMHLYILNKEKLNQSEEILKKRIKNTYQIRSNGHIFAGFLPGSRTTLIAVNNNHIYAAWSGHFVVKVYNLNGKYNLAFYYPYHNQKLNKGDIIDNYPKSLRQDIQKLSIPQTLPALHSIKIDSQGRLWISTIVKDQDVYQWWVLANQGKLLARFTWPRDKAIKVIRNGYVYTLEKNNKTEVQRIVKYQIQ